MRPSDIQKNTYLMIARFLAAAVCAFCTTLSMTVIIKVADWKSAVTLAGSENALFVAFAKLAQNINGYSIASAALVILFIVFYLSLFKSKKMRFLWSAFIPASIFGIVNVLGESLEALKSWDFVFANRYQIVLSLVCMAGYGMLMYCLLLLLFDKLDRTKLSAQGDIRIWPQFENHFNRKPFLTSFIILFLCWLPWLIVFYPGSVTWDGHVQLYQYFGYNALDDRHSLFSTFLMGGVVQFGRMLLNDNFGIFLWILLQTLAGAAAFAFAAARAKKYGCKVWWLLLFWGIVPLFGAWAQTFVKDTLYCYVFVFYLACLFSTIMELRKGLISYRDFISLSASALLLCFLRKDAVAVIGVAFIFMGFWLFNQKKAKIIVLILIPPILISTIFSYVITPAAGLSQSGAIRETLSLPFLATARYIQVYGDEVTPEERSAIDAVLDYDRIAELYNADNSNSVKGTYKLYTDVRAKEKLAEYFKVWFQMFWKHPAVCIEAMMNKSYSYFTFRRTSNFGFLADTTIAPPDNWQAAPEGAFHFHYKNDKQVRFLFTNILMLFRRTAAFSLVIAPATYTWLLIGLIFYSLKRKCYILFPLYLSVAAVIGLCIISPVNGHMRYFLPVLASAPFLYICTKSLLNHAREDLHDNKNR